MVVVEVALGQTEHRGGFFHGVNFSPTFDDPLDCDLRTESFYECSARSFLLCAHCDCKREASPYLNYGYPVVTAAFHLVCPALTFKDRGKTRLEIPNEMADSIASALWAVSKTIYKEEERRKKDAVRREKAMERHRESHIVEMTLKDAVFSVLPECIKRATDNGRLPVCARDLYYEVRPAIQSLTTRSLENKSSYTYFSQTLLTEYQAEKGKIENLFYDPRGVLYEPHTGIEVKVGTRDVEEYELPSLVFDKILYIEKKGMWPLLQSAQIAERFDMAVMVCEGYATEAARVIFEQADKSRDYRLFVLHDADPDGYNIARTLREATKRMPDYKVDVIDLGYFVEEMLALGVEPEEFTRKKELPGDLNLTDFERKFFEGRKVSRKQWIGKRIEISALRPRERLEYIERKLNEHGANTKVIPDENIIKQELQSVFDAHLERLISDEIERRLDIPALIEAARNQVKTQELPSDDIRNLTCDIPLSWREVAKRLAHKQAKISFKNIDWKRVIGK